MATREKLANKAGQVTRGKLRLSYEDQLLAKKLEELDVEIRAFRTEFEHYGAKVRRALFEAEGGEAR